MLCVYQQPPPQPQPVIPIPCLPLLVQPSSSGGGGAEQEGEGLMFAFTSIRRNLISLFEAVSPPPLLLRLDIFIACRHIRSTPTAGGGIF